MVDSSRSMQLPPAIVLAGGGPEDRVAASQGQPVKALVELRGRALVDYVVEALSRAGCEPIIVSTSRAAVGRVCEAIAAEVHVAEAEGPRFTDTLRAGLAALPEAAHVLLATGDLPLLTPEAVFDFVDHAQGLGADIVYSTVAVGSLRGHYARGRRLTVRLAEGRFTGGNLVLASPHALGRVMDVVESAFAGRKSPLALARILGIGFVLRFLMGRLDIPQIVARGREILGCPADVVISDYPEVCFDIDRPQDLEIASDILAARQTSTEG